MNWRSETAKQPSTVTKELFLLWVRSTHKDECGMYRYVLGLGPPIKVSVVCTGMLLPWLPAANGRSIGPEWLPHWSVGMAQLIYAHSQPVRPGQITGAWNSNYYCSQPIPLGAGRMHSAARYWLRSWWGVKACPLQPTQQELLPWFITIRPASFIPLPLSCQIEWLC